MCSNLFFQFLLQVAQLAELAIHVGSSDNTTVILFRFLKEPIKWMYLTNKHDALPHELLIASAAYTLCLSDILIHDFKQNAPCKGALNSFMQTFFCNQTA